MRKGGTILVDGKPRSISRRASATSVRKACTLTQRWARAGRRAARRALRCSADLRQRAPHGDTLKPGTRTGARQASLRVVQLKQANALEIFAPAKPKLVANPPRAERIVGEQRELAAFYPNSATLKQKFPGWNCYIPQRRHELPLIKRRSQAHAAIQWRTGCLFAAQDRGGQHARPQAGQDSDAATPAGSADC
jgi:hypothetical protein